MNQVILKLLENAIDAVGAVGRVVVRTRATESQIELDVVDDGPGVAPEALPHLFEPFFTTKPVGSGTGLGLATAFEIARGHGGSIALDRQCAKGARFVLTLPLGGEGATETRLPKGAPAP